MTEQEKAVNALKDNICMAVTALIRNLDVIVNDDPTTLAIEFLCKPYEDTQINFYRKKPEEIEKKED